jgi:hypothetical protein
MNPSGDTSLPPDIDPPVSATCPRCGYDQSGAIATWTDRCPLLGLCPECGLDFEWSRIIRKTRDSLAWSFEHAPRPDGEEIRASLHAFSRTLALSLTPWRLWRRMRMEYPTHPARLGIFLLLALIVVTCSLILLRDAITIADFRWKYMAASTLAWNRWNSTPLFSQLIIFGHAPRGMVPAAPWWIMWWLLIPPLFFLLPNSLRRSRVRKAHLARIFLYSLVLLPIALAVLQLPRVALIFASIWNHATLAQQSIIWGSVPVLQVLFFASTLTFLWSRACRDYLKLPNSLAIGVALNIIAFLITLGVYVLPRALGLVRSSRAWPETT